MNSNNWTHSLRAITLPVPVAPAQAGKQSVGRAIIMYQRHPAGKSTGSRPELRALKDTLECFIFSTAPMPCPPRAEESAFSKKDTILRHGGNNRERATSILRRTREKEAVHSNNHNHHARTARETATTRELRGDRASGIESPTPARTAECQSNWIWARP